MLAFILSVMISSKLSPDYSYSTDWNLSLLITDHFKWKRSCGSIPITLYITKKQCFERLFSIINPLLHNRTKMPWVSGSWIFSQTRPGLPNWVRILGGEWGHFHMKRACEHKILCCLSWERTKVAHLYHKSNITKLNNNKIHHLINKYSSRNCIHYASFVALYINTKLYLSSKTQNESHFMHKLC